MSAFEKVCLVVKETPLEGLKQRYGTKDQARFVLEQNDVAFDAYEEFDSTYRQVLDSLREGIPSSTRVAVVDAKFLPTYQFDPGAAVVTVGPDGLVANTAKYLADQPLIAVNPDPKSIDGVLARNSPAQALNLIRLPAGAREQRLAMAQAQLADGQTLLAVNDLFVGQRTHVSARYEIEFMGSRERQSSSGLIVSTGAGSTGWRRSVLTGASVIVATESGLANDVDDSYAFAPDSRRLAFAVREPFVSRTSSATLVAGMVDEGKELVITSQMPQNGVIFSDGIEADFLEFNSGAVARIGLAERTVRLWWC
jgi:NAD kinase